MAAKKKPHKVSKVLKRLVDEYGACASEVMYKEFNDRQNYDEAEKRLADAKAALEKAIAKLQFDLRVANTAAKAYKYQIEQQHKAFVRSTR